MIRIGYWYVVLTVLNSNGDDCLNPDYKNRNDVINYLRNLRIEYLSGYIFDENY